MSRPVNSLRGITSFAALVILIGFSGCSPAAKKARIQEKADRYFKAGEYDKAKIEYMNLLRLDPQNVTGFQQLGSIWSEQGVPLRATPLLLRVRELAPQNLAARAKLAFIFASLDWFPQAREEAAALLEQDPANSEALVVLADTSLSKDDIEAAERQFLKFPATYTATFHLAKAGLALRKDDMEAASDELEQAIVLDPNLARAHLVLANLYAARGDLSGARSEFKTAAEVSPLRSYERIRYAEFQMTTGAAAAAKTSLQEITQKATDFVPAWIALAKIGLTEKKYDDSLSLLENVFSRDPDNLEGRLLESDVRLEKGEIDKTIAILERLNTSYPGNATIKCQLGRAYSLNNNPAQATVNLQQAVAAKPDYVEAILLLGEINLRTGKPQAVVTAMEQLRKNRPDLPQVSVLLAVAYQLLGRLEHAASLFREQLAISPESAEDHFRLGLILRQQNKNDEARLELERAAALMPDNWHAIDPLVELDLMEARPAAALERVRQQLQRRPHDAGAHYLLGKIYGAQANWSDAESELRRAIELDPSLEVAYNGLFSVYVAQKKLPQAVAQLQGALNKNPSDSPVLLTLALIYERLKDYTKARDAYEKLVAAKPDEVIALNNLAYINAELLPNLGRAYELAQKARTLHPDEPSIGDTLGWILFKRADYQQALTILQESAVKLPQNPVVQFHLGMAAYMMGQPELARSAFEKALASTVDFPEKGEAQRRLASLKTGVTSPETHEATDVVALTRRAEDYAKNAKPADAAEAYEEAFRLNPKLTSAALELAQLYAGPLPKPDKAREYARKARALAPADAQVAIVLGRVAAQSGNFAWGYSLLQEAARQRRDDPTLLHDLAMTRYALGRVPEARQAMQRSVDLAPSSAQMGEAKQFLKLTAIDKLSPEALTAESEIAEILKTRPDYVPALMTRASIQWQRKDVNAAVSTYTQVLRQYPDFAPAQKYLAMAYVDLPNETDKAYDFAIKARRTLPDDAELAWVLAEISLQRKDFEYAIQVFEQAATKQSLGAKDLYYLGMAQLQIKQDAKGRETLQRAISAGLPDPLAQEVKKRLAEQPPK